MGLGKWLGIGSEGAGSSLLGGLVNGAFNLIGQGQQYRNQRKLNDQQQEHALEQMAQEQEYTKEMWNMNNEYNDPSAVIARGRAAGLSPTAALGQSSGGAGISTMATGAGSVGSSAGGASGAGSNPVGDLLQGAVSAAQASNIEQDTKLKEQQTRGEELRNQFEQAVQATRVNIEKAKEKGLDIENKQRELDYDISQLTKSLTLHEKQNRVLKGFAEIASIYNSMSIDRDLADSQISVNDQQIILKAAEVGLVNAQTDNVVEDTRLKGMNILLRATEVEYMKLKKELVSADIISQQQANEIDKFRNDFEKEHKEKDWKRERSNETIKAIGGTASGIISSISGLIGVLTPAGQSAGVIETVVTTIENYNSKGKMTGYTQTTTEKSKENFGK